MDDDASLKWLNLKDLNYKGGGVMRKRAPRSRSGSAQEFFDLHRAEPRQKGSTMTETPTQPPPTPTPQPDPTTPAPSPTQPQ